MAELFGRFLAHMFAQSCAVIGLFAAVFSFPLMTYNAWYGGYLLVFGLFMFLIAYLSWQED